MTDCPRQFKNMASMEEQFETACKDGTVPGAVLFASNRNSKLCPYPYRIVLK